LRWFTDKADTCPGAQFLYSPGLELLGSCFVCPLPKGHEARLPFVLLFPPLKREEQRMLPLPESSLTSAQPSDLTPPLPFFQLLCCCFSPVSSPLCFQSPPLLCSYQASFGGLGKGINNLPCLAFTHLCLNSIRTGGELNHVLSCVLEPSLCPVFLPPDPPCGKDGEGQTCCDNFHVSTVLDMAEMEKRELWI